MTALVATDRLEFAPPTTPGLLRALGLALLAHVFLLAALTWGVRWKSEAVNVTAEAELWSALPQQAAPKLLEVQPQPQPQPIPPPPEPEPLKVLPPLPPPPQAQPKLPDVDIALEREKLRLKKEKDRHLEQEKQRELEKQRLDQQRQEKLRQEKLALEKKRLKNKLEQDKKAAQEKKLAAEAAKRKETLLTQQEAKKTEIAHKANVDRATKLAGATEASDATGNAQHASGPSAGYAGLIRARIKPNIVFTDTISGNPVAEVEVRTAPDGTIVSRKLTQASGVKSWDNAVLKAIDKTEVLPRDLDGRVPPVLTIRFRPKD
jgi:colicin import membrane protein